ncbi:hypothetical protein HID58_046902, partial [Brassica napus]
MGSDLWYESFLKYGSSPLFDLLGALTSSSSYLEDGGELRSLTRLRTRSFFVRYALAGETVSMKIFKFICIDKNQDSTSVYIHQ